MVGQIYLQTPIIVVVVELLVARHERLVISLRVVQVQVFVHVDAVFRDHLVEDFVKCERILKSTIGKDSLAVVRSEDVDKANRSSFVRLNSFSKSFHERLLVVIALFLVYGVVLPLLDCF
jgi:hypothetical protein